MSGSILARWDRVSLDGGFDLRLLSALELLQARREGLELAADGWEQALCGNACLLARALERTEDRVPVFDGGREALAGLTAEEITALITRWDALRRENDPSLNRLEEEGEPAEEEPPVPQEMGKGISVQEEKSPRREVTEKVEEASRSAGQSRSVPGPGSEPVRLGKTEAPLSTERAAPPEQAGKPERKVRRSGNGFPGEAGGLPGEGRGQDYPLALTGPVTAAFPGLNAAVPVGWTSSGGLGEGPASGGEVDWVERADQVFRRDSRRYDGGFYLY